MNSANEPGDAADAGSASRASSARARPRPNRPTAPDRAMNELASTPTQTIVHTLGSAFCLTSAFAPSFVTLIYTIYSYVHALSPKQVRCEAGYFCRDATRKPCPAGTYGASTGLRDEGCSGMCPAGSSCAEGTVVPSLCEEGFYAVGGAVACNACPGKRAAGVDAERCRTSRSCCA